MWLWTKLSDDAQCKCTAEDVVPLESERGQRGGWDMCLGPSPRDRSHVRKFKETMATQVVKPSSLCSRDLLTVSMTCPGARPRAVAGALLWISKASYVGYKGGIAFSIRVVWCNWKHAASLYFPELLVRIQPQSFFVMFNILDFTF